MGVIAKVPLFDLDTGNWVSGEIWDEIGRKNLSDWKMHWLAYRTQLEDELVKQGVAEEDWPESLHWDWPGKSGKQPGFKGRSFSIVVKGRTEAMMLVLWNKTSRKEPGAGLVYIDYLEIAPWNWGRLSAAKYKGLGLAFIVMAIRLSQSRGWQGRLGLHSLPQAERFYRNLGMQDLGQDSGYEYLRYFEMSPQVAQGLLKE